MSLRLVDHVMYSREPFSMNSIEILSRGLTLYSGGFSSPGSLKDLLKNVSSRHYFGVWWVILIGEHGRVKVSGPNHMERP